MPARDWAILILTVAVVLAGEAANTVLETIVDVISPEISEPARIAKDAAAGAVLMLAMGAVVVGLFILGPPLWLLLFKVESVQLANRGAKKRLAMASRWPNTP